MKITFFLCLVSVGVILGCSPKEEAATTGASTRATTGQVAGANTPKGPGGQNGSKAFRGADTIEEIPPQYRAMAQSLRDQNKSTNEAPKAVAPK